MAIETIDALLEQLPKLSWKTEADAADLLTSLGSGFFGSVVDIVNERVRQRQCSEGILHPKSTHAKLLIAGTPSSLDGSKVWVHDYSFWSREPSFVKSVAALAQYPLSPAVTDGFARENLLKSSVDSCYVERWHNHRHGLASLIGDRGYVEDRVSMPESGQIKNHTGTGEFWLPTSYEEWNVATHEYTTGDVMSINGQRDYHRIHQGGGFTFVIQGPGTRNYSQVLEPPDAAGGEFRVTEMPDMPSSFKEMLLLLGQS